MVKMIFWGADGSRHGEESSSAPCITCYAIRSTARYPKAGKIDVEIEIFMATRTVAE